MCVRERERERVCARDLISDSECTRAVPTSIRRAVILRRERDLSTGVPRSEDEPPPTDPTVGLCLGPYGGPQGGGGVLMSEVTP